jgi:hypothetical protein
MRRLGVWPILLLAACGENSEIEVYTVTKEPSWRMLGAVVPAGESTWFFKLVAPSPRALERKKEVEAFFDALKVENGEVRWTTPAGWTEEKGGRADRVATLRAGDLEMSVTRLGGSAGGTLANVNRWRGQIGLPALAESELAANSAALPAGGVRVDLEGPKKPSMGGASAARAPMEPPPSTEAPPPDDLDEVRNLFAYTVPSGWTVVERPGPMRLLELKAGEATASLTYLQGDAGGLAPNINRWRGQVGLAPMENATSAAAPFPFLNGDGHFVEIAGAEKAMLVVFRLGPPFSLFLKLDGPKDAVLREKAAFEAFARSVRVNR